jgi:hypothetical protein
MPIPKAQKLGQIASPSFKNLHLHLPNRAKLSSSRFLTPKPPSSLGRQICSHLILYNFSSRPPPHKKLCWICYIFQNTARSFGKRKVIQREACQDEIDKNNTTIKRELATTPQS